MDVGTVPRRSAGLRARARGARLRAGRAPLGDRRQPAAPLLGPGRRAGARRRLRAGLPGLDRQGARFRLDPRGVRRDRRRGPGAGGQNPGAPGRAVRASPRRLRRPARHAALPLRLAQVVRGGPGARPEVRRGAPGPLRGRSRAGSTRRCRVHLLHLGDDGKPEGRDAHPRQRGRDGPHRRRGRGVSRRRRLPRVSADGVGGRRVLHAHHEPLRRVRVQLPREPRDGPARPA